MPRGVALSGRLQACKLIGGRIDAGNFARESTPVVYCVDESTGGLGVQEGEVYTDFACVLT
jgi:hypothetical protein